MASVKSSAQDSYIENINAFNSNMKFVGLDLKSRYPNDPLIYRAHKRLMFAIGWDPLCVIKAVGPYLYNHRTQVYAMATEQGSEDFFIENSYDDEIDASSKEDGEKFEMVKHIFPRVKQCAKNFSTEELNQYKQLVIDLLDDYVEFLYKTTSQTARR